MAVDILYKEESYKIIGVCMKIHTEMGAGFLESVYNEIMVKEFMDLGIPFEREKKLELFYGATKLHKFFKADFICYNDIILEIKSVKFLYADFDKQLYNYLKATRKRLGILINFGEKSLTYKRILNSQ